MAMMRYLLSWPHAKPHIEALVDYGGCSSPQPNLKTITRCYRPTSGRFIEVLLPLRVPAMAPPRSADFTWLQKSSMKTFRRWLRCYSRPASRARIDRRLLGQRPYLDAISGHLDAGGRWHPQNWFRSSFFLARRGFRSRLATFTHDLGHIQSVQRANQIAEHWHIVFGTALCFGVSVVLVCGPRHDVHRAGI